ncbi:MAG: cyclodeaminase/cyclohydrolase family protein [Oscillospiraceae bacterium]|jgi:formiminotetrahydrofolate cyclodeaminase|nr:cyclodeaminase/cyclohydrolase family protein [Oscillospiraceae bacterium]
MKLADITVNEFTKILASEAPAPGGGSTAALHGALGASLVRMVALLTGGREKYREHEPLMKDIAERAEALRIAFIDVMDRDTKAFDAVSEVFSMPKTTDGEKAARRDAMQKALKACTLTPLEMMRLSLEALELMEEAAGKTNESAASDFGVGAISLKAASQGAWLNVLINLGGIRDQDFAEKHRAEGEALMLKAATLADSLCQGVLSSLYSQPTM